MAIGNVTVEIEGVSKDFVGFELVRNINKPANADILFPDTVSVSAGDEITIKEDGSVRFGGYADEVELRGDRKQQVQVEGYGTGILDSQKDIDLTGSSPEAILTEVLSGTNYTLSNSTVTGITVVDYDLVDKKSKMFRDMIDRTQYVTRWEADKTIYFNPVGEQNSGYSYDTSSDNVTIDKWSKNIDRMKDYGNKITVKGRTSIGASYSSTVSNSTAISNYGEYYRKYEIDYLSNSTEATDVANKLLVTSADEGGKIRVKPNDLTSYLNETIGLIDSTRGIDSDFVCYEQRIKYPNAVMSLHLGYPETITSDKDKRLRWLAENAHDSFYDTKTFDGFVDRQGDTMEGDLVMSTSGLSLDGTDGKTFYKSDAYIWWDTSGNDLEIHSPDEIFAVGGGEIKLQSDGDVVLWTTDTFNNHIRVHGEIIPVSSDQNELDLDAGDDVDIDADKDSTSCLELDCSDTLELNADNQIEFFDDIYDGDSCVNNINDVDEIGCDTVYEGVCDIAELQWVQGPYTSGTIVELDEQTEEQKQFEQEQIELSEEFAKERPARQKIKPFHKEAGLKGSWKKASKRSTRCPSVVSYIPGNMLGDTRSKEKKMDEGKMRPITLNGSVPYVYIEGRFKPGDILVSAGNGKAMVDNDASPSQRIGYAKESGKDKRIEIWVR